MRSTMCVVLAAGTVCAVSVGVAVGQDSVSVGNGLPGDAVSQFTAGAGSGNEQVNNYVVDLVDRPSSWGKRYRVGPLAKASVAGSGFFNHLVATQAVSSTLTTGPFLRSSYDSWAAAGQGVSFINNTPGVDDGSGRFGPRSTAGFTGGQFAVAMLEFGGGPNGAFGDGDDENNIVTSVVNFQQSDPRRLYVSRVNTAIGKPSGAGGNTSTATMGLGSVDAAGSVHLLADGYGLTASGAVSDKRLFRVNATQRVTTQTNQLSNSGGSDATATRNFVVGQTTQTTPAMIPASVAGRPVMLGVNFAGDYLFEGTAGALTAVPNFLAAGAQPRGPLAYHPVSFARTALGGSTGGTIGVLSRANGATRTRGISLLGVNINGSLDSQLRIELPTTSGAISDPTDGFFPAAAAGYGNLANQEFANYAGQVCFRGGNGPVAMTVLPNGDLLVAATVAGTGTASSVPASMESYIAVARVDAATGAATWVVAAHTGNTGGAANGSSKVIRGDFGDDGTPGTSDNGEGDGQVDTGPSAFIGRLARASEALPGVTNGPSLSSPAMDRLGNLYFLAHTQLKRASGGPVFRQSLIRANFDSATNRFELEEMLTVGDVVAGANSGLNYQVQFMGLADADSADSGAVWSGNIVQDFLPGVNGAALGYADPRSLAALVVRCKVVYDRNNDGTFADPTVAGNAGSPDQGYNVAFIVMPPTGSRADFNNDGVVNPDDLADFIACFFTQPCPEADFDQSGGIDPDDLADYIAVYFNGE
jgi:hypothetical protein